MSEWHRLLQRQIRKHLGGEIRPELVGFVQAVDAAYADMDKDKAFVERTLELSLGELLDLNGTLHRQQAELSAAMHQVMESLRYASRLQRAQLPHAERLCDRFADFSVHWSPRDTIGGDLWWVSPGDAAGRFSVVIVDCTGHGVPGAMVSLLASTSLEQIYSHHEEPAPAAALRALDRVIRRGLNQDKPGATGEDGCDAAIVQIDPAAAEIHFAGSRIDLFCVSPNRAIERIGGGRDSLGYPGESLRPPQQHTRPLAPEQMLVMASDGLFDQIGLASTGRRRSFGVARLIRVLEQLESQSCVAAIEAIDQALNAWQGAENRRDDVTVLAFALPAAQPRPTAGRQTTSDHCT
jgi:hypothetical protein